MKTLFLSVAIKTRRGTIGAIKETSTQNWRWESGMLILRLEGEEDEFVLPMTSVQYERRTRQESVKK